MPQTVRQRRKLLTLGGGLLGLAGLAAFGKLASTTSPKAFASGTKATTPSDMKFEITKTPEEWKALLTPSQYAVLREHATERPGSSRLNAEKRAGIYHCAACDLPAYSSETKYESGTGWPSFWQPLENAVGTMVDNKLFMTRKEVHCARCGGHQGHVFNDGPKPTGLRYCINGLALKFEAA